MREISRLSGQGPDVREIDTEIERLLSEISALTFQKIAALGELRQGMFCTGCQTPCSVLIARGEPCPHEGQSLRPATPAELAAKAREYDDRIEPLQARKDQLSQTRQSRTQEFRSQLDEKRRELEELRRRAADLNAEISRANSEEMQARNGVILMEQKEALEAAQKRMAERAELKAKAEKERYQAQIYWQQAEDAQRRMSASKLTDDWKRNQPGGNQVEQDTRPPAEEPKLEETARQAREQASRAAERAAELDQRARSLQADTPGDAPLERVAQSIELIEAAEQARSSTVMKPGQTGAAAQLLALSATKADGVDVVGQAVDRFSNVLREAEAAARTSVADGKKILKAAAEEAIRSKMEDTERQFRNDLVGLAATTRLDDKEGIVPDKLIQGAANDAFGDAASIVLSDVNERSPVVQSLTDSAVERVSGWCTQQVRNRIISLYNEKVFGIADMSNSTDPLERAEDAVWKASSQANLVMRTGFVSLSGYRKYLGEVLDRVFEYVDLVPDRLSDATDPDTQAP